MQRKSILFFTLSAGVLLAATAWLWLASTTPASAQCGSQASSCKNCHEVQAQKPVNTDGSAWHSAHAFGDFCYICHAGNNQATGEDDAHAGMVHPLFDVNASCLQCHPADAQELALTYADELGIELGTGGQANVPGSAPAAAEGTTVNTVSPIALAPAELDVQDPNLVDYSKTYDEIVLGKKPVNWGNVILLIMIVMIATLGGGFVLTREKLIRISFGDLKSVDQVYPTDVVEMLPAISRLKASSRKLLKGLLDRPKKAEKILELLEAVASDQKTEE